MPTNLPPHFFEVEKKLKTATTPEEKIACMEEMLGVIPKHKGTEKLRAMYKTKIAKTRNASQKKSGTAKHGPSHKIQKSGAGQVVVIGTPNAGKSLLIKNLSETELNVSESPYTTHEPHPAMMKFENIQVQLVDMPPITPDFMEDWYPDVVKAADAVIFLMDLADAGTAESTPAIMEMLTEKHIQFIKDEKEITENEFLTSYKKTLLVANKCDHPEAEENMLLVKEFMDLDFNMIPVSALTGENLENLRKTIFLVLNKIRVYSKIPGKKAEYNDPFTLKTGSTVMDMAKAVHKDFAEKLQYARIWSKTKYDGQRVNRHYILEDEDVIELHM